MPPSLAATTDLSPDSLQDICANAWADLLAQRAEGMSLPVHSAAWITRAAQTLAANLSAGRFEAARPYLWSATTAESELLRSYARQVIGNLINEAGRLAQLIAGETAAWRPVIERLERLAYHWYGPNGREPWAAWEAREAAAATCADLWLWLQSHPYPFDVQFDRWAARALVNRLHNRARQRQRVPPDVTLDEAQVTGHPAGEVELNALIVRETLHAALAGLPARQAAVIRLWYLEGWPADEIAARLRTRISNVYVLRCRGLKALRRTWQGKRKTGRISGRPVAERATRPL